MFPANFRAKIAAKKTAAPAAAPAKTPSAPAGRKKIGLKKVADGAAGSATIQAIHEGDKYDSRPPDGMAVVTVRFGKAKDPKAEKGEAMDFDNRTRTSEIPIPSDVARKFKVGQKVRVSLTPA